ncbi:MAG: hypothetical protein ABR981_05740 [Candidatus Micrarchaeaceae archaeon]|jgi:hypothetical protein
MVSKDKKTKATTFEYRLTSSVYRERSFTITIENQILGCETHNLSRNSKEAEFRVTNGESYILSMYFGISNWLTLDFEKIDVNGNSSYTKHANVEVDEKAIRKIRKNPKELVYKAIDGLNRIISHDLLYDHNDHTTLQGKLISLLINTELIELKYQIEKSLLAGAKPAEGTLLRRSL